MVPVSRNADGARRCDELTDASKTAFGKSGALDMLVRSVPRLVRSRSHARRLLCSTVKRSCWRVVRPSLG